MPKPQRLPENVEFIIAKLLATKKKVKAIRKIERKYSAYSYGLHDEFLLIIQDLLYTELALIDRTLQANPQMLFKQALTIRYYDLLFLRELLINRRAVIMQKLADEN